MTETGWPADWAGRMAGDACPMCDTLGHGDNDFGILLATGDYAEIHLQRRSRVPGYCSVIWRHGHVAEPTDLTPTDAAGYWSDVLSAGRAIAALFHPVKVNYLTLGNTIPHLHTHVVPRYSHDPAPRGPLAWNQIESSPLTRPNFRAGRASFAGYSRTLARPATMPRSGIDNRASVSFTGHSSPRTV